jgi:hypothetical protein
MNKSSLHSASLRTLPGSSQKQTAYHTKKWTVYTPFSFFSTIFVVKLQAEARTVVQQKAYNIHGSSHLKVSNLHQSCQCLNPYSSHSTVQTRRCLYCNKSLMFQKECLNMSCSSTSDAYIQQHRAFTSAFIYSFALADV